MGSWSVWHWLIVLLVVALVFGTKKLRDIGSDLGSAVKGFKEGMRDAQEGDTQGGNTQDSAVDSRKELPRADTIDVVAKEPSDSRNAR